MIHTTDGTFASARTAARVSRWHGISLTSSVHTTTPDYTRVFTPPPSSASPVGRLSRLLLDRWAVARAAEAHMQRLLDEHHRRCAFVLASRADDRRGSPPCSAPNGWACFAGGSSATSSTRAG